MGSEFVTTLTGDARVCKGRRGTARDTHCDSDEGLHMINRRTFSKAVGLGTGAAAVSLAGLQ
ncbi:hypothetical protein ACWDYK_27520, partial [Streptomyces anthocyanicus]